MDIWLEHTHGFDCVGFFIGLYTMSLITVMQKDRKSNKPEYQYNNDEYNYVFIFTPSNYMPNTHYKLPNNLIQPTGNQIGAFIFQPWPGGGS